MAFLTVPEVAERLRCSQRTVWERTRLGLIPHRRLPGSRRCLFREDELEAWIDGAELEHITTSDGGRIVRPRVVHHRHCEGER
jgi:excisionase family DNA binding protein